MKSKKGEYGYISSQTKRVLAFTILLFFIALTLFIVGYITTGTKRNLLTIVAVLGCLPACKSLVNLIMFLRAKGCSANAYEALAPLSANLSVLYDLYLTTYKVNYPLSQIVLKGNVLCGYTEETSMNTNECEEHLQNMLKQDGYKNITVKIFTKLSSYEERLKQLNELDVENNRNHNEILEMLLSISL